MIHEFLSYSVGERFGLALAVAVMLFCAFMLVRWAWLDVCAMLSVGVDPEPTDDAWEGLNLAGPVPPMRVTDHLPASLRAPLPNVHKLQWESVPRYATVTETEGGHVD